MIAASTRLADWLSRRVPRGYRILFSVIPYFLLLSGFHFEWTAIRVINHGRFIYTLDDAYIHLALAERIAQGHYGINLGEASAPASSILWPFLLALFTRTGFMEYLPLWINLAAAVGTLYLYTRILRIALAELPDLHARAATAWIAVFLIFATNLIGLAFTGMEHSLQVFLSALIVLGMLQVVRGLQPPAWLVIAIIAAPSVRYECLTVSGIALALLLFCRRWKAAAFGALGMLIPLAAFAGFLHAHGLGWLPTSVTAKVAIVNSQPTHDFIRDHLFNNLATRQGQVLGGLFLLLAGLAIARRNAPAVERLLAAGGAGAILAHLAAGQIGWWERYEVYMLVTGVLLVIYLARGFFQGLFWSSWNRRGWTGHLWPPLNILLLGGLASLLGLPYFGTFGLTPLASANIYEQQYQMHRFVVDYLRAPVAVNDLGWVAFQNPNYVLDLWGLASAEALANRQIQAGPAWMERMVQARAVRLVMIYDTWLPTRPESWVRVARLRLGWKKTVVGGDTVSFYVPDPQSAASMRALLAEFKPSLPPGVRLEIIP